MAHFSTPSFASAVSCIALRESCYYDTIVLFFFKRSRADKAMVYSRILNETGHDRNGVDFLVHKKLK